MSATNGVAVLDKVREAVETARANNQPQPSQAALAKLAGTTRHHVRQALAELAPGDHDAAPPVPDRQPGDDLAEPAAPTRHQPDTNGRHPRPWPLILIGAAAAVAVWGGWVDLAKLTGFGMVQPLPGVWDSLWINTAIALPLGIEAYGAYALRTWLSSSTLSARTRRFARWSALVSLAVGAGAQVASHLMRAADVASAPPIVTVLVSCVPVGVLGLAVGLATLVRQDTTRAGGG